MAKVNADFIAALLGGGRTPTQVRNGTATNPGGLPNFNHYLTQLGGLSPQQVRNSTPQNPGGLPTFNQNLPQLGPAPGVLSTTKHPVGSGAGPKTGAQNQQAALVAAAQHAINAQYNPAIAAIDKAIARTQNNAAGERQGIRRRGNRAVGDLAALYGNLRKQVGHVQRHQDAGYNRSINTTRRAYGALNDRMDRTYKTSDSEVAKDLRNLGLDPNQALKGSAQDQSFLHNLTGADRAAIVGRQRNSRTDYNGMMRNMKLNVIATGDSKIGASRDATNASLTQLANSVADKLFTLRSQRATTVGSAAAARLQAIAQAHAAANPTMTPAQRASLRGTRLDNQSKALKLFQLMGGGQFTLNGKTITVPGPATSTTGQTHIDRAMSILGSSPDATMLGQLLNSAVGTNHGPFTKGNFQGTGKPNQGWNAFSSKDYPNILDYLLSNVRARGGTPEDQALMTRALQTALGM